MSKVQFCPYCMSGDLKEGTGGFIEMGSFEGSNYQAEGNADGYSCNSCGGQFWANGPDMPLASEADESDDTGLPVNMKDRLYDLRGPAGNAFAIRGNVEEVLKKVNPEWAKEYNRRLDENPEKTWENLIRVSREFVEFNWIGLPTGME